MKKLEGLQIARGIAAFSIAYFHSWVILMSFPAHTDAPILLLKNWGYLSIDFFFAISGFVICLVIDRPDFNFGRFLMKRAFRLYPIYWICLWLFCLTTIYRGPVESETTLNLWYSFTLMPWNGYPYYDVAWSVRHEILFYLIAGLIVPRIGLKGLVGVLAASAVTATWFDIPLHDLPVSKYHADFAAGVLAFMTMKRFKEVQPVAPFLFGAASLVYVCYAGYTNLLFVPFDFLILGVVNFKPSSIVARPFLEIGNASYSLYLIHPLVFIVGNVMAGRMQPLPIWAQEPIRWAALAVCCILAYISWRVVERPMIKLGEALSPRLRQSGIQAESG